MILARFAPEEEDKNGHEEWPIKNGSFLYKPNEI
jgi:hypothetical protein